VHLALAMSLLWIERSARLRRLERLAEKYFASNDQALLSEAVRLLRRLAEQFDQRERSS
jgi:hypothetical protein